MVGEPSGEFYNCFGGPCNKATASGLDELAELIHILPSDIEAQYLRGGDARLDGEPARWESLRPSGFAGGPPAYYTVMAMHDSRPVILQFDHWAIKWGYWSQRTVDEIVASFQFIEPVSGGYLPPPASPIPALSSRWEGQQLVFAEAGFQVRIPRFWNVDAQGSNVVMGGEGTHFSVRVGDAQGRLLTCDQPDRPWERCRDVVVTTLDEFADAVKQGPVVGCGDLCPPAASGGSASLAGEDAWRVTIFGYEYPAHGGENALYILALHEGRPYFLRFHTSADRKPGFLWDEIVASFEFVDSPTAGGQTFTSTDAGFAIDVPASWVEEPDDDPNAVWIHGSEGGLKIRVGDGSGNILNCNVPPSSPCVEVLVGSVEDLVELLTPTGRRSPPFVPGSVWLSRKASSLGNISAVQMTVRAWESGPSARAYTRHYVVAMDRGRPVIIKWEPGTFHGREFQQLLSSFRFLD